MEQLKLPLVFDDSESFEEMSLDEVAQVLSRTIVDDDINKKTIFLAMLSAYTDKSQINISINAPSSSGKTYLATQIAALFPAEDKVERSGASPTSFFYEDGVIDEERGAKIVSLKRKILIFHEQPNPELQVRLRALLSHDSREIIHSLTNKGKGGRNKTDKIILEGFPATIFCSAGMRLDEQEATRAILISPEATQAKINASVSMQFERGGDEEKFAEMLESYEDRNGLMRRIVAIRDEHVNDIIIPDIAQVKARFLSNLPVLLPRHSRDTDHFLRLIKSLALLNVWYRRGPNGEIHANAYDIEEAFKLWETFFETQNLNVPPAVLDIYKKYIKPAYIEKFLTSDKDFKLRMMNEEIGLTVQELLSYHLLTEGVSMNGENLRKQMIPQLEQAGVIAFEKPEDGDKRSKHLYPKRFTDEELNKLGRGGSGDKPGTIGDEW